MPEQARLEDLLSLNEEIAALVAARAPLVSDLPSTAAQLRGDHSGLAPRLRERMAAGATLDVALAHESDRVPRFYTALVRAGIASRRLPAALEAFGDAYRRLVELRRLLHVSLIYPVGVALLGVLLLFFGATTLLPTYDWIGVGDRLPINLLRRPAAPLVVSLGLGLAAVAVLVGAAVLRREGPLGAGLGAIGSLPGCRGVARLTAQAAYASLLGQLVRNEAPLPDALRLAAEATGWPPFERPSAELAEHVQRGGSLRQGGGALRRTPPLVRTALLIGESPRQMADALDAAANDYEARARAAAQRLATCFPAVATVLVGGVAAGAYALLMLQPYITSLIEITTWPR